MTNRIICAFYFMLFPLEYCRATMLRSTLQHGCSALQRGNPWKYFEFKPVWSQSTNVADGQTGG